MYKKTVWSRNVVFLEYLVINDGDKGEKSSSFVEIPGNLIISLLSWGILIKGEKFKKMVMR